jgi:hypothetical protein
MVSWQKQFVIVVVKKTDFLQSWVDAHIAVSVFVLNVWDQICSLTLTLEKGMYRVKKR